MPYINIKTNSNLSEDNKLTLKEKLGKAISIIPGKSENWLMVNIDDNCSLFFRGSREESIAFVEVKIFGKTQNHIYDELTKEICEILSDTIGSEEVYVKYEEAEHWGYNGYNF